MINQVEAYYDAQAAHEWTRLERHRMEFALNAAVHLFAVARKV